MSKLELSGAHTPCAPSVCSLLHRDRPVMLTISTRPVVHMSKKLMLIVVVGTDDRRGYNGQQIDAICDVRGPCEMIQSTLS